MSAALELEGSGEGLELMLTDVVTCKGQITPARAYPASLPNLRIVVVNGKARVWTATRVAELQELARRGRIAEALEAARKAG